MKFLGLVPSIWLAFAGVAVAQEPAPISGQVRDALSRTPLSGVAIDLIPSGGGGRATLPTPTGADGKFAFDPADHLSPEALDTEGTSIGTTSPSTCGGSTAA
jgi:hypothetical protein